MIVFRTKVNMIFQTFGARLLTIYITILFIICTQHNNNCYSELCLLFNFSGTRQILGKLLSNNYQANEPPYIGTHIFIYIYIYIYLLCE